MIRETAEELVRKSNNANASNLLATYETVLRAIKTGTNPDHSTLLDGDPIIEAVVRLRPTSEPWSRLVPLLDEIRGTVGEESPEWKSLDPSSGGRLSFVLFDGRLDGQ